MSAASTLDTQGKDIDTSAVSVGSAANGSSDLVYSSKKDASTGSIGSGHKDESPGEPREALAIWVQHLAWAVGRGYWSAALYDLEEVTLQVKKQSELAEERWRRRVSGMRQSRIVGAGRKRF